MLIPNFIGDENSHDSFSKDPLIRADAKRRLNGYILDGAIMVMTEGLMGRIGSAFGTSISSIQFGH